MFKFIRLKKEHLEQVLKWRTSEQVTRYMYTDIEYNLLSQFKWFERVSKSLSEKYWIISYNDIHIGLIYLSDLDLKNKKTKWGYYIGQEEYRIYGGIIPLYLYNYLFNDLKLNKIIAEVMEGNNNVMKLHRMHGYREVGVYKKHVYKYNKYHDVYVFEMTLEQWAINMEKYKNYRAKF